MISDEYLQRFAPVRTTVHTDVVFSYSNGISVQGLRFEIWQTVKPIWLENPCFILCATVQSSTFIYYVQQSEFNHRHLYTVLDYTGAFHSL